jgi:hypothetical protein
VVAARVSCGSLRCRHPGQLPEPSSCTASSQTSNLPERRPSASRERAQQLLKCRASGHASLLSTVWLLSQLGRSGRCVLDIARKIIRMVSRPGTRLRLLYRPTRERGHGAHDLHLGSRIARQRQQELLAPPSAHGARESHATTTRKPGPVTARPPMQRFSRVYQGAGAHREKAANARRRYPEEECECLQPVTR